MFSCQTNSLTTMFSCGGTTVQYRVISGMCMPTSHLVSLDKPVFLQTRLKLKISWPLRDFVIWILLSSF